MSDELVLNLASNHINSIHQFNEKNLGLGYRFDNKVEVGFFQNSYYKNDHERANGTGYSVYFKTTYAETNIIDNVTFGIDIGAAY